MAKVRVDQWVAKSKLRLEAVFKQSVQNLAEEVQEPIPKGGHMPVDTGYLRNSFGAALNVVPRGVLEKGKDKFKMDPIVAVILRANLGDKLVLGWSAEYAIWMEARYGYFRLAKQKWDEIVKDAIEQVKRDYNDVI